MILHAGLYDEINGTTIMVAYHRVKLNRSLEYGV